MIEVVLLDADIPYHAHEWPHFNQTLDRKVPVLTFEHEDEIVNLVVYASDDFRGALKMDAEGRARRGDAKAVQTLIDANRQDASSIEALLTEIR